MRSTAQLATAHRIAGQVADRPTPLSPQETLDVARCSRLEHAARRARQHIEHGHRADFLRAIRDAQEALAELTSWADDQRRTGLLYRCDECARDFPAHEISVGAVNLCTRCAA